MTIAKLVAANQIESTWMDEEDPMLQTWLDSGWKPLIETSVLTVPGEFERVEYTYTVTGEGIRQEAVLRPDYAAEIAWNRKQLDAMDWKAIRNTIAERAGRPLPIPWETLYAQTQACRDRINALEQLTLPEPIQNRGVKKKRPKPL